MKKVHHNNNARLAAAVTNYIKAAKRHGWTHRAAKTFAYLKYNIKNQNSTDVDYAWIDRAKAVYGGWEAFEEAYRRNEAAEVGGVIKAFHTN
tara:strand:- start:130 stop:405 length:276 start_codon:yes stop_codon:yes gene_type:complete